MRKKRSLRLKSFTLIETLVVVLIIGGLILLFAPKLLDQKDIATRKSDNALVKVVHEQYQIYLLAHEDEEMRKIEGKKLTNEQIQKLLDGEYITENQKKRYDSISEKDIE
ncbi:MAG: competence protein ComG [Streptococcaceae bacterium]|jgi:competence protein ComGC|nr:competence protein ComG [Streptococcaceae bacterium]